MSPWLCPSIWSLAHPKWSRDDMLKYIFPITSVSNSLFYCYKIFVHGNGLSTIVRTQKLADLFKLVGLLPHKLFEWPPTSLEFLQTCQAHPYVMNKWFPVDWEIAEMLKQYLCNQHQYAVKKDCMETRSARIAYENTAIAHGSLPMEGQQGAGDEDWHGIGSYCNGCLCHDSFPMLRLFHSTLPHLPRSYSTNHTDQFKSHTNRSNRPLPVASQAMAITPVGTYPHSIGDVVAFQGHMAIMWWSCNHVSPAPPVWQAT